MFAPLCILVYCFRLGPLLILRIVIIVNDVPGSPHEAVFGGEGFQAMKSVKTRGPGLVAVGLDASGSDRDAAVWTSPDGITWSRYFPEISFCNGLTMNTITRFAGTIGIIGLILSGGACSPEPITLKEVAGSWRDSAGAEYIQFNQDKSYRAAMASDFNPDSLVEIGRFSLKGRDMTINLREESPSCAGEHRRFEVQTPGDRLRLIWQDGDCDLRPNTETYELERVQ